MVTVAQLIELLKQYPDNLVIAVDDYGDGGGYNPLSGDDFIVLKISDYGRPGSYYGQFVKYEPGDEVKSYSTIDLPDVKKPFFKGCFDVLLLR